MKLKDEHVIILEKTKYIETRPLGTYELVLDQFCTV